MVSPGDRNRRKRTPMNVWVWVVIAMNVLAFGAFGLDKSKARRGKSRIPEAHLLLLSALSGAPAGWLAMSTFRHKTQKLSFQVKMVLATLVNAVWVWLWWKSRENSG